jgi:hypothetical protein
MPEIDNPKESVGSNKLPMHLWPPAATALGCISMANGAWKYGRNNYRAAGIRASVYQSAAKRHLDAWFEGEEFDPDDGVPHLGAALACIGIIIDADAQEVLIDDRNFGKAKKFREFITRMTAHIPRLKELHKDRNPRHYTIADDPD